jgi:hypothetical protein
MHLPGALRPGGHRGNNHPHLAAFGAGVGHMLTVAIHPDRRRGAGSGPATRRRQRDPDRDHPLLRDFPLELGDDYFTELGVIPPAHH